jgi:hypothetical protein
MGDSANLDNSIIGTAGLMQLEEDGYLPGGRFGGIALHAIRFAGRA